ncbi:MAG: hypothetical protein AAFQ07_04170, partial [Chloroflexota bacterium]
VQGVLEISTGHAVTAEGRRVKGSYHYEFSLDDRYFVDSIERIVVDLENNEDLFEIPASDSSDLLATFSPDSTYLAVVGEGVYTLPTGEHVFDSPDSSNVNFSPDGTLVAFSSDGVYEVGTWEQVLALTDEWGGKPYFSDDNTYLHLYQTGVYNVVTGERLEIPSYSRLSPNGDLMIDFDDGIYDLATQEEVYTFEFDEFSIMGPAPRFFNTQQTVMARSLVYSSDDKFYFFCLIYGVEGTDWAYRSGMVNAENKIVAYVDTPNGEELNTLDGILIVLAQTEDSRWYRVAFVGAGSYDGEILPPLWISAEDVTPISMPEGIPIEDPNA